MFRIKKYLHLMLATISSFFFFLLINTKAFQSKLFIEKLSFYSCPEKIEVSILMEELAHFVKYRSCLSMFITLGKFNRIYRKGIANKQFCFFKLSWLSGAEKKGCYSHVKSIKVWFHQKNRWLFKQHRFYFPKALGILHGIRLVK